MGKPFFRADQLDSLLQPQRPRRPLCRGGKLKFLAIAVPKAAANKINADIAKALAEADVHEKFETFGYEPFTPTREQFTQYIAAKSAKQAAVIVKAKAALD